MRLAAVLKSLTVMSLTALSVAVGACATGEKVDDGELSALGQETTPTLPADEGTKLPASNPPSSESKDAGTASKDASPPKDSGSTATDSGPPPSSTDCDPNDPTLILKLALAQNPSPCPCSAAECCLAAAQVCLPNF